MRNEISIPMNEIMSEVTVTLTVTGARRLAFRMWLGGKIIAVAEWVMGCHIDVVDDTE